MKTREIVEALHAQTIAIWNQHLMEKEYTAAFASDLMSDALAMIQNTPEDTILITGLCNAQVLRTAEMLDIEVILFVRGKKLNEESLQIAKEMGFNIFTTDYTMYDACGILYSKGLRGISSHAT